MGPIGYPAPPPSYVAQDEPWPPPHWQDPSTPPAGAGGPPGGEPSPWPPPQWKVGGDPGVPMPREVQPTQPLPAEPPPPGVLAQQHQVAPAPAASAPPKGAKPAAGQAAGAPTSQNPYVAGIEQGAGARAQAVDQEAAAKEAENEYRGQRAQGVYMATQLGMRQAEDDYKAAKQAGQQKAQALAKEVDDLGKARVDPNRVFANMSTAQRIATFAALFAGGMQSAFTGHNTALEALNRIMDRDFEQQKEDLATRKEALGAKQSMLAQDLAAGKDEYEARVKHWLVGADMAMKEIDAEAAKFQSPQIRAAAQEKKAEIQDAALGKLQELQRYGEDKAFREKQADRQNALGWYNAQTGRMGEENNAAARQAAIDAKNAGKQFPIKGGKGEVIGYAGSEKEQESARTMIDANAELSKLYERGRELFKDGWAAPGSEQRARQEMWNNAWASARFRATGRTDAPTGKELEGWGIPVDSWMGNNMAILDESYTTARDGSAAKLRASGIPEETLKGEGFIPPPTAPTPGKTEQVLYQDENGIVNSEGRGTPLSPEETANWQKRKEKFERDQQGARGMSIDQWKYRRDQNNWAAKQGRALPFPGVGTGPID